MRGGDYELVEAVVVEADAFNGGVFIEVWRCGREFTVREGTLSWGLVLAEIGTADEEGAIRVAEALRAEAVSCGV